MRAHQLHYTSCKAGESGGSGLQTRASTPGMSPEIRREVEGRMSYRPPRDAPDLPTPEQLQELPVAFRYFPGEGGRWVALRLAYAGQDYTRRWGNIFGHAILGEGGLGDATPVDLMDWEGWRGPLAPEEDTEGGPPPLPPAELSLPPAEPTFGIDALTSFLQEAPARAEVLARMVAAVLSGRTQFRPLAIRDRAGDGPYWIATVFACFPPAVSRALSYSTYQFHDRGCADVNATTGDTDLPFDEQARRSRFYAFDLVEHVQSDVPADFAEYGGTLARWLAETPRQLARFHEFAGAFDDIAPDGAVLTKLLRLFLLPEVPREPAECVALGQLGVERLRPASADAFARHLDRAVAAALARDNVVTAIALAPALSAACARGSDAVRGLAGQRWIQLYDRTCTVESVPGLQEARTATETADPTAAARVRAAWLEEAHLGALYGQLLEERAGAGSVRRSLTTAVTMLLAEGRRPSEHAWVQEVLAWCGEREPTRAGFEASLAPFTTTAAELAWAAATLCGARLAGDPRADALGTALSAHLAARDAVFADAVRVELDRLRAVAVLHHEALATLAVAPAPEQAWDTWLRRTLPRIPHFATAGADALAAAAVARLPPEKGRAIALDLVATGRAARLPTHELPACLRLANDAVLLDAEAPERVLQQLAELAARAGLALAPDRPLLHGVLRAARSRQGLGPEDLRDIPTALRGLPPDEYERFATQLVKPAIDHAKDDRSVRALFAALATKERTPAFLKIYERDLEQRLTHSWARPMEATLVFWLLLGERDELAHVYPRRVVVLDAYVTLLARNPELDPHLRGVARAAPRPWPEFWQRVERERKGVWGRVKDTFTNLWPWR